MPAVLTTIPANAPSVADTPEFKELQKQLGQAKAIISSIDQQIIAIEAKMKPNTAKGAFIPDRPGQPFVVAPQSQDDDDLNEMMRIAGLRN
jgi:ABC-type Fe3+-hydroxamate transport system substrate-binding protein